MDGVTGRISQPFGMCSEQKFSLKQVIYAINAGSINAHTDIHGIRYERDPLFGKSDCGTASEFGRTLLIARSHLNDQILYQTER